MRIDYRAVEKDIPPEKFVRALITLLIQQLNQLRAFHGLPALTRAQVIAGIKQELRNL